MDKDPQTSNIVPFGEPRRAPLGFRIPPHNIEAEQALLGAILVNNDAYYRVGSFLRPEHFYEPVHGRIFAAMARLIGDGHIADHVTLKVAFDSDDALRELNGAQYLGRMARAAESIVNAQDYGRHVQDLALRRGIITISEEAANVAYDPQIEETGFEQVARMRSHLDFLERHADLARWRDIGEVARTIAQGFENPVKPWATGLPLLDKTMTGGGLRAGLTYGVEATRKSFKTGLAGTIALSLLRQDLPFLFLAMEMGSERIVERLIGAEEGFPARRFREVRFPQDRDPRFELPNECKDLIHRTIGFIGKHGNRPSYWADLPGVTFGVLRSLLGHAVHTIAPCVVFVDYWQRIKGCPKHKTPSIHLAEVADWLTDFGAKHQVAMVVLSQTNRHGESFMSDGLVKAADWFGVLHKLDHKKTLLMPTGSTPPSITVDPMWIDLTDSRDSEASHLGTEAHPAFYIDDVGPVLREVPPGAWWSV